MNTLYKARLDQEMREELRVKGFGHFPDDESRESENKRILMGQFKILFSGKQRYRKPFLAS